MRLRSESVNGRMAPPRSHRATVDPRGRWCDERDDRGKDVDNRPGCEGDVTNLVDKSLDGVTPGDVLLVLPEGATNI